jgi:2-methylisocitrate lyase-like PEP mutase family enzyme
MGLLGARPSGAARLRRLLERDEPLCAPGAYDALSARLVAESGFEAVYMTGFGASASVLGRPDVGLLTGTEMAAHAERLVDAVDVPVIADADTGYGNVLNVIRTVRAYERAGVAALHLEDQVAPKKCGHLAGKAIVPVEEHVAKIRAAVAARTDPDTVVIARTDARAVEGFDAAIERAERYAAAGADILFVEAPQSIDEIAETARRLSGHALLFNWAEGGRTPPIPLEDLATLGYRVVIFPLTALLSATTAVRAALGSLRATGTPHAAMGEGRLTEFGSFVDDLGLPEVYDLERRFLHD